MDFNELCVFIPVSDMDHYCDFDACDGYGGLDQLVVKGGIIVMKSYEDKFRSNVEQFEKWENGLLK